MQANRQTIGVVLLALLVLVGMGVPVTAVPAGQAGPASISNEAPSTFQQTSTPNNSSVNVTVGQQLSTIISVSSDEVQSDFENVAFSLSVELGDDDERAEALEDRAEDLRERAEEIHDDYAEATEEYEEGELTKSEYAQRLATLNARATNLLESYEQFQQQVAGLNATNRSGTGLNLSALNESIENVDVVSGSGVAELLRQFTGESSGEIEIETANGLEIEIESEDGEFSREFERPRDDDNNLTVNESDALETARGALSAPENGSWVLSESDIDDDDGVYEFEFVLNNASGLNGEAEVSVDGSSGVVFSLEEEIEAEGEDDRDDEEEGDGQEDDGDESDDEEEQEDENDDDDEDDEQEDERDDEDDDDEEEDDEDDDEDDEDDD